MLTSALSPGLPRGTSVIVLSRRRCIADFTSMTRTSLSSMFRALNVSP